MVQLVLIWLDNVVFLTLINDILKSLFQFPENLERDLSFSACFSISFTFLSVILLNFCCTAAVPTPQHLFPSVYSSPGCPGGRNISMMSYHGIIIQPRWEKPWRWDNDIMKGMALSHLTAMRKPKDILCKLFSLLEK